MSRHGKRWDDYLRAAAQLLYSKEHPFLVNYLLGMELTPALSSLRLQYHADSKPND